ncbi:GntR family transcriptional regulator [Micromonospora sp. NPDC049203]|uniref:GntR family transcriptional regulator n=1 Tax=Micromonospora sp. NPDC049203 TaxID=3364267 RepID=UPI0037126911
MPTPHHGQPRYRAIAEELGKRIKSGLIPPGALLPAESSLAAEFRASRGTIRQAITVLREAQMVATEHGRGSYANPRQRTDGPDERSEAHIKKREVSADAQLADLFAVKVGALLIEDEHITYVDGSIDTVVRTYRLHRDQQHPTA